MKHRRNIPSQKTIISLVAVLALVGVAAAMAIKGSQKAPSSQTETPNTANQSPSNSNDNPAPEPNNPAPTTPTVSPTPNPPASTGQKPSQPILNVSSSTVPAGALVSFVCEGAVKLNCNIILTRKESPSQQIRLGDKVIADNGRGQYFASWNWESVQGTWIAVARVTNNDQSSDSKPIEVVVQ